MEPPRSFWDRREQVSWHGGYFDDPLNRVISTAMLAWGLAVFAVWAFGWMPQVGEATPWDWVWTGAGAIILLETLVRLLSPDFERPSGGRTLLGGSLVLSGLHSPTGLTVPLWLVVLVFGTWLVVDRARQQRRWGQDASAQADARQDADPPAALDGGAS